jgi:hypothetical protein
MADFWGQIQGGYQTPGQGTFSETTASGLHPTSSYWDDYFRQQMQVQPPTPVFNTTNQDQARTQQQQVIQDLQRSAAGDPNSRAQQQLQQANMGAQSQQSSLGSTMRGQSAGAAQRSIQAGQQDIQRQLPGDQQMLMAQEQQAAQSMLAQILAQQQSQDISQATAMAQGQLSGQSALDNFYRQMFGGALESGAAGQQNALNMGLAAQGFDLEGKAINQGLYRDLMNASATATASAGNMFRGAGNSGGYDTNWSEPYRQVGGQDSIVSYWDK